MPIIVCLLHPSYGYACDVCGQTAVAIIGFADWTKDEARCTEHVPADAEIVYPLVVPPPIDEG